MSKENSTEPAFGGTGHDSHKEAIHDPGFYAFSHQSSFYRKTLRGVACVFVKREALRVVVL